MPALALAAVAAVAEVVPAFLPQPWRPPAGAAAEEEGVEEVAEGAGVEGRTPGRRALHS